ncbi:MAG: GNAT family N-acetyltransferase [Acidobacteria bacterium]|nr:MAG: GNAT family N-acetyltransferase [Acidobacteriota bacterium]
MIYQINPIQDRRWETLVERHPRSSIFHRPEWLEALQRTYGYKPVVYTTSGPREDLTNGLVFCSVSSWITGKRLVSLPFSDHCDPLLEEGGMAPGLLHELYKEQKSGKFSHVEFRPRNDFPGLDSGAEPSESYCFHAIDLERDGKAIYSTFHKDCIQRKIKRADKEELKYVEGRSVPVLRMFYTLFVETRQRQRVPPQPFRWFQNLAECLGPAMQVRLALHGDQVAAGIVTLQHQKTMVYKYGCSDTRLNNLGGMPWLFWKAIQDAKERGLAEMDLGRSSWDNEGLVTFKDRLGGKRTTLNYWKYPQPASRPDILGAMKRPAGWVLEHTPQPVFIAAGRVLYRHFG